MAVGYTNIGDIRDDPAPTGNGSMIALLKAIRDSRVTQFPATLTTAGNFKVAIQEGPVATTIAGTNYNTDTTMQSAAAATGVGTAMDVSGMGAISIQVTGTFVGTITFQVSSDGVNFTTISVTDSSTGAATTTATAPGLFSRNVSGFKSFRANITAYTSGTITVTGHATTDGVTGQIRTALYGKNVSSGIAGDTPLAVQSAGNLNTTLVSQSNSVIGVGPPSADTTFSTSLQSLLTASVPHFYNGSTNLERARSINLVKTGQSTALATGGDLLLWVPTTGKKFRLRSLRMRASVAGRYEARDSTSTIFCYFYLAANQWTEVLQLEANGFLAAFANDALVIRNQSGSAADIDAVAAGNEE